MRAGEGARINIETRGASIWVVHFRRED